MSHARRTAEAYADIDPEKFGARPARRTRPRTKDRPDYSDAEVGRVLTVDRGRFRCQMLDSGVLLTAAKARQLGRKGVIVGDLVRVVGDTSGEEGTLARIVEVEPRSTVLLRTADDTDPTERPIVANADQLMIVSALADPPPRPGMIDRLLVAAYDAGISPILCLTKADLAEPDEIIELYEPLGVPVVVTEPESQLDEVDELLVDHVTVLVGHSGVGKSTLINRLVPGADRSTAEVSEATGRGRHTSTSAVALQLPGSSGWVIDTPGVRSFGLSHVTCESVLGAFGDLTEFTRDCPRGCRHTDEEPECGLDEAVAAGRLTPGRLASFRRIVTALLEQSG